MKLANINIIIVAEETPRSKYFRDLLVAEFDADQPVDVVSYEEILSSDKTNEPALFIIDLMDFDRSAYDAVEELKQTYSSSKIIALHIYQSEELVKPLFERGADGYISSDPTRKEFFAAVTKVLDGQKYFPDLTV
ncbi:response regulator [Rhodohalobacter halophilus]|uniref:response regulator transcription factor n=1 Tax=Rhodohalobacter halophilus TaxID=1812810 RepID=UPI00083FBB47|nr:response regulator transcription factor [Rhodohalobacter halophilus]